MLCEQSFYLLQHNHWAVIGYTDEKNKSGYYRRRI